MKKLCFLFFFVLLITIISVHVCASAESIQKAALWPAIKDIEPTKDGEYIFTVNVRAYCPQGMQGDLLVAAYDDTNRLLEVVNHGSVSLSRFNEPLGNCDMETFLQATSLADGIELKLEDKDNIIIKAFVINLVTLKPEIESGKIKFFYNNGDSYVDVDYTLESKHENHVSGDYYYYYYYDGECESVEFSLTEDFYVGTNSSFTFQYYHTFENSTGIYYNNVPPENPISYRNFSGVKIRTWIASGAEEIFLERYGFKTKNIRIHCNFGEI